MITECVAMHDQPEKMVRLISFFTLHAHIFAGFIMQSLLEARLFYFLVYSILYEVSICKGERGCIMSIRSF